MGKNFSRNNLYIVNQFFPPDNAATGQLLNNLTKNICSKNLQIIVLTGMPAYASGKRKANNYNKEKNRIIIRTNLNKFWKFRKGKKLINGMFFCLRVFLLLIKNLRNGDRILFTTEPPFTNFLAYLIYLIKGNKFFLIQYDIYPDILINLKILSKNNLLIKFWKFINYLSFKKASKIVVLNNHMARIISEYGNNIKSKIAVIPSWADANFIKPIKKRNNWFIKRHSLGSKFVILYSGNQGRCHDFETIKKTILILKSHEDILFLFIGNGYQNNKLREFQLKNRLKNIKFLPFQEYKDIPFSLNSGDIALVSLSRNFASLVAPSKLYGHLAAGTPIGAIAPKNSYLSELVEKEKLGKCFNNGDSKELAKWIKEIKQSNKLTKKFKINTRNYLIQNASSKIVFKRYLEIINN